MVNEANSTVVCGDYFSTDVRVVLALFDICRVTDYTFKKSTESNTLSPTGRIQPTLIEGPHIVLGGGDLCMLRFVLMKAPKVQQHMYPGPQRPRINSLLDWY